MDKINQAVIKAEQQGFAKFKSDTGADMVVCTQKEIDAVIEQQKEEAVRIYCENMGYA